MLYIYNQKKWYKFPNLPKMRSKKQVSKQSQYSRQVYEGCAEQESQRLQEEGGLNQDLKTRIHQDEEFR